MQNIHHFRMFINRLYPDNVIRGNADDDMLIIQSIINRLESYTDSDKIKNMQLGLLKEQLSQIHQCYIKYMKGNTENARF